MAAAIRNMTPADLPRWKRLGSVFYRPWDMGSRRVPPLQVLREIAGRDAGTVAGYAVALTPTAGVSESSRSPRFAPNFRGRIKLRYR